jgi:hypothetical protein
MADWLDPGDEDKTMPTWLMWVLFALLVLAVVIWG